MLKNITKKKVALFILLLFTIIQFIRIDKTVKPVDANFDFISITNPDVKLASILKTACYDCHSNQSIYPWYTNIAPISWWIKHHINEGSRHLNFSVWASYSQKKQKHKLEECISLIEEDKMPMYSYTLMHKEARLSAEQKELLLNWFNKIKNTIPK